MGEWIGSFHLIVCKGYRCIDHMLLIILVMSVFLLYKTSFRWLSSVCRCSLSEMVKALCTSELIADCFCAGWWCDSACKYLSVCVGFLYT